AWSGVRSSWRPLKKGRIPQDERHDERVVAYCEHLRESAACLNQSPDANLGTPASRSMRRRERTYPRVASWTDETPLDHLRVGCTFDSEAALHESGLEVAAQRERLAQGQVVELRRAVKARSHAVPSLDDAETSWG